MAFNQWGGAFCHHAFWMLVQTGVLFAVLWLLDRFLRGHIKATIRYAIWLLVLVKLVLPVDFKLPSGIGYWLHWRAPQTIPAVKLILPPAVQAPAMDRVASVPQSPTIAAPAVIESSTPVVAAAKSPEPAPVLSIQGWILAVWTICVFCLFAALLIGVAEPHNQLHERITLMMRKAIPTNAKMGLTGFVVLLLIAAVLLPMATGPKAFAAETPAIASKPVLSGVAPITQEQ